MIKASETFTITLSREELIYLLFLIKSGSILGMDIDPIEEKITEQQKALVYAHAERSLRARELVNVQTDGQVVVRDNLLLMVATCAYPEFLIAFHAFPSSGNPRRIFWNGQNGVIISHERPAEPLHRLSFLKNREELLSDMFSFGDIQFEERIDIDKIQITNEVLREVRKQVKTSKQKTVEMLKTISVDPKSAIEFCNLLEKDHTVIACHSIAVQSDKIQKQDVVNIIAGKNSTWFMKNLPENKIEIESIGHLDLINLFKKWTDPADAWFLIPSES